MDSRYFNSLSVLIDKLVPCAWFSSGALEVWRLRLNSEKSEDQVVSVFLTNCRVATQSQSIYLFRFRRLKRKDRK